MKHNVSRYKDIELLNALKNDKKLREHVFAEIYSRYSQRVYAYIIRIMGSQQDSQDIFQDTFLKFYNNADHLEIVDNIPGLLITIARNLCINFKRNIKETSRIEEFNLVTHDAGYEQKDLLKLIASALELLEFENREAFILRQYHGLSYHEIASIVGDSETAIKSRVWRTKERIKEILAPYLEDLSK